MKADDLYENLKYILFVSDMIMSNIVASIGKKRRKYQRISKPNFSFLDWDYRNRYNLALKDYLSKQN